MSARWIPSLPEISRETLAVIAGAIIAGIVVSQIPALKAWLRENSVLPPAAQ